MGVDLEPVGALATAGLVAKEIEGHAGGAAHGAHVASTCANCNAPLVGAYCHQCGQTAHVHRSLLHIAEELAHGILHFDTKSWRTLPLLVARPGLLTRRYIDGQRARYVSPLALFLFSVFLMFFVFSMIGGSGPDSPAKRAANLEQARKELSKEIDHGRKLVAEREAKLAQAKTADERQDATEELADARSDLHDTEITLAALNVVPDPNPKDGALNRNDTARTSTNAVLDKIGLDQSHPTLSRIVRHAAENRDLTLYKLKNSAYKFAFMLVPISLPFLWLIFFWRKGVTMYDHAIFTLYGLSFLSLWGVLIGLMLMSEVTDGFVAVALLLPPVHIFMQLKETYALGWFATAWRTIAVLVAGSIVLALFTLLVLFISLH
jgi:Protein of unknown function (DUF3667)